MTAVGTHRIVLGADMRSVRAGRRFATELLSALDPDTVEVVVLLISELVTNAIMHGGPHPPDTTIDLSLAVSDDGVRIEVTDGGEGIPTVGNGAVTQPSGRGLILVQHLARQWGCDQHQPGKTVWVDVALPSRLASTRSEVSTQ